MICYTSLAYIIFLVIRLEECDISSYDDVFLSYNKIIENLKLLDIKTKTGKIIDHKDLVKAISIMNKKHSKCRWQSEKVRSKKYFILKEGYYWLIYVYFQNENSFINADIKFFKDRIKQYEEILNIKEKELFNCDIEVECLDVFFNRKIGTVKKAIQKMIKVHKEYRYLVNEKYVVSKEGIKWLCENCFKNKYLELLENYKMELTEMFIQAGYIYDNFFEKN